MCRAHSSPDEFMRADCRTMRVICKEVSFFQTKRPELQDSNLAHGVLGPCMPCTVVLHGPWASIVATTILLTRTTASQCFHHHSSCCKNYGSLYYQLVCPGDPHRPGLLPKPEADRCPARRRQPSSSGWGTAPTPAVTWRPRLEPRNPGRSGRGHPRSRWCWLMMVMVI